MTFFLGIDSGLRNTGWGIIKKDGTKLTYITSGVIKTKADNQQDIYKSDALALKKIYDMISNVIMQYQPSRSAIENTYINSNPLSSIKLAQARAVAILACSMHNMIPREYQASTIKKVVTGKGNADKIEVNKMITLQLGHIKTETSDESDAIATAICDALSN